MSNSSQEQSSSSEEHLQISSQDEKSSSSNEHLSSFQDDRRSSTGWIVLTTVLTIIIIVLIFVAIIYGIRSSQIIPCQCFGSYGIIPGRGGTLLRTCGTNQTTPCVFIQNTINDAISQCDSLSNICQGFSYNETQKIMRIIDINSMFDQSEVNAYIKQDGLIL